MTVDQKRIAVFEGLKPARTIEAIHLLGSIFLRRRSNKDKSA